MKKFFFLICCSALLSTLAHAEDDFFDNLIVDQELKEKVNEEILKEDGQLKASEILEKKPIKLNIDQNLKLKVKEQSQEEIAPIVRDPAPFGLKWLATKNEILYLHVNLEEKLIKDSPNSFTATNLPKPVKSFREVLLSFGDTDSLWRIAAYGNLIDDDSKASKGVAEYQKFYNLLNEKYGNAEEFYTPAVINVEEETVSEDGKKSKTIKQKLMQIGDEGFKEKLMSGESSLFSTFKNNTIGVTLALIADGNGQTYIVINYQNLKIEEIEMDEIYEAL